MYKNEICKNCRFFTFDFVEQYVTTGENNKRFQCRRFAPRMFSGSGEGWSNQLFPVIREEDWCGEFEFQKAKRIADEK